MHGIDIFVDSLKTGFKTNIKDIFKFQIPIGTKMLSAFSRDFGMRNMAYEGQDRIVFTYPKQIMEIFEGELLRLGYVMDS